MARRRSSRARRISAVIVAGTGHSSLAHRRTVLSLTPMTTASGRCQRLPKSASPAVLSWVAFTFGLSLSLYPALFQGVAARRLPWETSTRRFDSGAGTLRDSTTLPAG